MTVGFYSLYVFIHVFTSFIIHNGLYNDCRMLPASCSRPPVSCSSSPSRNSLHILLPSQLWSSNFLLLYGLYRNRCAHDLNGSLLQRSTKPTHSKLLIFLVFFCPLMCVVHRFIFISTQLSHLPGQIFPLKRFYCMFTASYVCVAYKQLVGDLYFA